MMSLKEKVVFITGASSGIGRGCAYVADAIVFCATRPPHVNIGE